MARESEELHTMTAERRVDGVGRGVYFAVEQQLHGFSTRAARDAWVAEQRATPMVTIERVEL